MYKINFDGASKGNLGHSGFSGLIRDHTGNNITIFLGYHGWDTNNSAELEGLWQGLLIAQEQHLFQLIVEGDSQILIHMATKLLQDSSSSKICNSWRRAQRLMHMENWINNNRAISFTHIKRDGNKIADFLANVGVDCGRPLLTGDPATILLDSQLKDFHNQVQKEKLEHAEELRDPGDCSALNGIHAQLSRMMPPPAL